MPIRPPPLGLLACAVVFAAVFVMGEKRAAMQLNCDGNLAINPPPGGGVQIGNMLIKTDGSIESEQMKRMEAALDKLGNDFATMKDENVGLKDDVAVLKGDNTALKATQTALLARVGDLEAAAAAAPPAATGGASAADLTDLKSNITKLAESHAADMAVLRSDVTGLNVTTVGLVDAVTPDMSWCPEGAKHVPADMRIYGSRSGFGDGAALRTGVYCIESSMDLRMARLSVMKGDVVELIGKPGAEPIQLKFGGFTVVQTATLKVTDISLQVPEVANSNTDGCRLDSEWLAAAASGAVNSGGTSQDKKYCRTKSGVAVCCSSDSEYAAYRGFPKGYRPEVEGIQIYGLFEMIRGDISHSYVRQQVLLIYGGGKATFTNISFFDNYAMQLAVIEMYSGPSLKASELELHGCHIFGDNSGSASAPSDHGFTRVSANSKITVRSSHFVGLIGNKGGAFTVGDTTSTFDIDSSSTFDRCFVPAKSSGKTRPPQC